MKNLHELLESTKENFKNNFISEDFVLTKDFKEKYSAYLRGNGQDVDFNNTTAIIKTSGNLSIYAPNQWFVIASYVVVFLQELYDYRKITEEIIAQKKISTNIKKQYIKKMKEEPARSEIEEFSELAAKYFEERGIVGEEKDKSVEYITKFISDYAWWSGSKTIDRGDYYVSPILNLLGLVNASQSYVAEIANNLATVTELADASKRCILNTNVLSGSEPVLPIRLDLDMGRKTGGQNLIIYGAPGTGKSRALEDLICLGIWDEQKYDNFKGPYRRVVFHAEYTYFDFVGTYKPVPVYKVTNELYRNTVSGKESNLEPHIDYQFVPGPFITVLIDAWLDKGQMHTLLIEEINRANAASVFGEIFQLLDRKRDGSSEYALEPAMDLRAYLSGIEGVKEFLSDGIRIPSNMNIVATMNSADQGVNFLDSAFKRRWNYKYKKIDIDKATHREKLFLYAGKQIIWGDFITALNKKLIRSKVEEDRLIGPFFIKPDELDHSAAMYKLLLYLWDDVLRHQRKTFFSENIFVFSDLIERFTIEDVLSLSSYFIINSPERLNEETIDEENA